MIDFNIPISGVTQAEESVNQIAQRREKADDAFATDVTVSETEDEMTRHALNVLA